MPVEPLPPVRELLNLGIVLECPFLHQVILPTALQTTVFSSQKSGPSAGVTAYSYVGTRLVKSVFTGGDAMKTIDYHYTPADPAKKIARLEADLALAKEELKAAKKEKVAETVATKKQKIDLLKSDLKKLKKEAKAAGFQPMTLVRSTFVETAPGMVGVQGETVYEYESGNVVRAVTTSETDEEPPRAAELTREYTYNDLGQLVSMDLAGCVTEFTYAPTGQLLQSSGGFVSPAGDFISEDGCVYTYAPPGSDPIATNALLGSLTNANSGPAAEFGIPTPEVSAEDRAAGVIPSVDPKAQMEKLTAQKAAEAEAGNVPGTSKSSASGGEEAPSMFGGALEHEKGSAGAAVTTAASKASELGMSAPADKVPSFGGEAATPEIPEIEKITTKVVGLYVYA